MTETYTKRFTSPINEDTGTHQRFLGHARSRMELDVELAVLRKVADSLDKPNGRICWHYRFIDGQYKDREQYVDVWLWFNNRRLVHFEGVHELCDEAIELLEENGFNADYAKV